MAEPKRVVYQGAAVFDGTGAPAVPADIAVQQGRIAAVGSGLDGDVAVTAVGTSVLPGFVDCHVHVMVSTLDLAAIATTAPSYRLLQAARNLRLTLAAGVTLVRDCDGADAGLRQAVADGLITGPRMRVAVSMVSQTGGRADAWMPAGFDFPAFDTGPARPRGVADGVDEVRRTVRGIVRAEADLVKFAVSGSLLTHGGAAARHYRDDEIAAIVAEADAAGLPAAVHAHSAVGAKAAVKAGVRSVEHGTALDDETIELMAARGTWLVPTLAASMSVLGFHERHGAGGAAVDDLREMVEGHQDTVRRAWRAGVPIAMGSDSGVTRHGENLAELAALAQIGIPATEVLRMATRSGARLLGADGDCGTIEVGKRADLIFVDGGLDDLKTLPERVRKVLIGGRPA